MPQAESWSPRFYARIGGLIYLAIIGLGLFGEAYVRGTLIHPGDAAASAASIHGALPLWRGAIAGDLTMQLLDVPLTVILYYLLRPAGARLALLATFLNLIQTAVLVANKLTMVAALQLLTGPALVAALPQPQWEALAYAAASLHGYGFGIGLIFFGAACLVRGYLMARSGYFPVVLGALLALAGVCYLINSYALILAPGLAAALFPIILLPAFVGELAVTLWLLIKGVDVDLWRLRQRAEAEMPR